jgi:uncharacterized membrane protein YkoI
MKRYTLALLLWSLAAGPSADHETAYELVREGRILPLEQILEQQRRDRPGRILEVELEREDGRMVYELELLDADGRVWEIYYDAASGRLLETEAEHPD